MSELTKQFVQSSALVWQDNGRAPRNAHDYGFQAKFGIVNHIPVTRSLWALTNYFNGGNALGSTQFGTGRETHSIMRFGNVEFPVAEVHQYMPIVRNTQYPNGCSPWAQGVIATSPNCPIPMAPIIFDKGLRSGQPNGAFISIENCAMTGADGVTDAQFNSNVILRAYCADLFGFPINPYTQLWHAEFDQKNRCEDPGWSGALENEMQNAARAVLGDSTHLLRGLVAIPPQIPHEVEVALSQISGLAQNGLDDPSSAGWALDAIVAWANYGKGFVH